MCVFAYVYYIILLREDLHMQIQKIQNSQTNFNGKLGYITKAGETHFEDLQDRLPAIYKEFKKAVQDCLKDEPFDVFISKGETPLQYVVKATDGKHSTVPQVVQLKDYGKQFYRNDADLAIAIFRSISNFKRNNFAR